MHFVNANAEDMNAVNELIDPVPFFYERPFVAFKQTKGAEFRTLVARHQLGKGVRPPPVVRAMGRSKGRRRRQATVE